MYSSGDSNFPSSFFTQGNADQSIFIESAVNFFKGATIAVKTTLSTTDSWTVWESSGTEMLLITSSVLFGSNIIYLFIYNYG